MPQINPPLGFDEYRHQANGPIPGRRVLLVVSDGYDGKSVLKANAIKAAASRNDITIFALSSQTPDLADPDQSLNSVIKQSGGLFLYGVPNRLPKTLADFIDLLRGRYIIEFPMPSNFTSGDHFIDVALRNSDAIIRTSAITVPLTDPSLANNPTTIHNDTSNAPLLGKHHPPPAPNPD